MKIGFANFIVLMVCAEFIVLLVCNRWTDRRFRITIPTRSTNIMNTNLRKVGTNQLGKLAAISKVRQEQHLKEIEEKDNISVTNIASRENVSTGVTIGEDSGLDTDKTRTNESKSQVTNTSRENVSPGVTIGENRGLDTDKTRTNEIKSQVTNASRENVSTNVIVSENRGLNTDKTRTNKLKSRVTNNTPRGNVSTNVTVSEVRSLNTYKRWSHESKTLVTNIKSRENASTNRTGTENKGSDAEKKINHASKIRGVVILTNYRSGSTFCGELFNQHPEVYFSFEPLYPFGPGNDFVGSNASYKLPQRIEYLRDLIKCKFRDIRSFYSYISRIPNRPLDKSCIADNVCFRSKTRLLNSRVCNTTGRQNCYFFQTEYLRNVCTSKKVVAAKVIRLLDITKMKSMLTDPSLDVKVIHLARDPRGIANSRKKLRSPILFQNMNITCNYLTSNMRAGSLYDWLGSRYKLIRYEDLAQNPIKIAEEIYDFVGLPFPESVKTWVIENTKKNSGSAYSTSRNSKKAMQAWRNSLPFNEVKMIQQMCKETMKIMGYKLFNSVMEQHNFNISVLV